MPYYLIKARPITGRGVKFLGIKNGSFFYGEAPNNPLPFHSRGEALVAYRATKDMAPDHTFTLVTNEPLDG